MINFIGISTALLVVLVVLNLVELTMYICNKNKPYSLGNVKDEYRYDLKKELEILDEYLVQDRELIVKKMNETRNAIIDDRYALSLVEDEINGYHEMFKNGVSSDKADKVSERYVSIKNDRVELQADLKMLKKEFSRYSHILSIIDSKLV